MSLTYEAARRIVDAALAAAAERSCRSSVCVVDAGRELVAFARMDGATLASIEIAQNKAYTARSLNMSTADLGPLVQPGGPFWGIERTDGRPLVPFAGGLPIVRDGTVIGAVGVSGGTLEEDEAIARAGLAALGGAEA